MRRTWVVAATALAIGVGSGCAATESPREREADRVARVVADAISYPRQSDADGFVRAAHDVQAGRDGRLTVVAKEGAREGQPSERIARLTFRVFLAAEDDGWNRSPEVVRCYRVDFSRYGVMDGSPTSTECPARTTWVAAAPAPPRRVTPVGSLEAVRRVLRHAPVQSTVAGLTSSVRSGLPAQPTHTMPPDLDVGVAGRDLGVAVRDDGGCLLGARIDGRVLVWVLDQAQAQPGEIGCTPASALGRLGIHPPH
jgi:hypothetical protein